MRLALPPSRDWCTLHESCPTFPMTPSERFLRLSTAASQVDTPSWLRTVERAVQLYATSSWRQPASRPGRSGHGDLHPQAKARPSWYPAAVLFHADIVVMASDSPELALVVEVKVGAFDRPVVEQQLRAYMLARRCSVALLVTPDTTWVYKDTFSEFDPRAIVVAAELATGALLGLDNVPEDGVGLEQAVYGWLERLAASWPSALPVAEVARTAVVEHLVPEVAEGRVLLGAVA